MYHSFLSHSSADRHLGCVHVLAIINSAVMNIGVHGSLSLLVSSVCMPSSGIAGSYGSSISCLIQAILQSHSHQVSMVLAQRQKYRSMEQNRKPGDQPMHLWTPYL